MTERRFVWGMIALSIAISILDVWCMRMFWMAATECYRNGSPWGWLAGVLLVCYFAKQSFDLAVITKKFWSIRNEC